MREMEFSESGKKRGVSCSRGRCAFLVLLWIVTIVAVGLLVGFLVKNHYDDDSNSSNNDLQQGGTQTTTPPVQTTSGAPTCAGEPWCNLRLPRTVLPVNYNLSLFPDFYESNDWFTGNIYVHLNVSAVTDVLLIHIRDLDISRTQVFNLATGEELDVKKTWFYDYNEFWVTELESEIPANSQVALSLGFNGSLSNGIVGMYKSTYVNSITNKTIPLASSKFQPTDARKAFPCMDEPDLKAHFTVTIKHRNDYTPLSNMPVASNETDATDAGFTWTHFEKSNVVMSTYLVCFVISDFEYLEKPTQYGKPFRVYGTPDRKNQLQYALDSGVAILNWYEDYFNMTYSLPKLDMIAIPDFVSGAMEHWGLITYRETNLLYDPLEASSSNLQRVLAVISHELAHMWFGNIVTNEWWDDLWLNEGFASFIEWDGMNAFESKWNLVQQAVSEMQGVFGQDALLTSHPIVVQVARPEEITAVFDAISYSKGSSVIRMLETFMGKDAFRDGIRKYMIKYHESNARTDDLWSVLQSIPGAPNIKQIMDTWTRQMGFPVINVTMDSVSGSVTVRQSRFLANIDDEEGAKNQTSEFGYRWAVPVRYYTSKNNTVRNSWLNMSESMLFSTGDAGMTWVKINADQTGYYQVNYDATIWDQLINVLNTNMTVFSTADRAGLVHDAFSLASASLLDWSVPLRLVQYIADDSDYVPWNAAESAVDDVGGYLAKTQYNGLWRTYIEKLTKKQFEHYGWRDNGTFLKRRARVQVVSLACEYGQDFCLESAQKEFNTWIDNGTYWIPPNLRSSVYRFGMWSGGGVKEWDEMWDRYKKSPVPQERIKLLYGLAHVGEPWILKRYLEYCLDEEKVRGQDFSSAISYISGNPVGLPIVWDWLRENYQALLDRFGLKSRTFGRLAPNLASKFDTDTKLAEVEALYAQYEAGAGAMPRLNSLATIRKNIAWNKEHLPRIVEWLENNV